MNVDPLIATKVNDSLKVCAGGFARSATECANPQLRNLFAEASQKAIRNQEQLTTMMEQRGWYRPPMARAEDIEMILPQLQALTMDTATV